MAGPAKVEKAAVSPTPGDASNGVARRIPNPGPQNTEATSADAPRNPGRRGVPDKDRIASLLVRREPVRPPKRVTEPEVQTERAPAKEADGPEVLRFTAIGEVPTISADTREAVIDELRLPDGSLHARTVRKRGIDMLKTTLDLSIFEGESNDIAGNAINAVKNIRGPLTPLSKEQLLKEEGAFTAGMGIVARAMDIQADGILAERFVIGNPGSKTLSRRISEGELWKKTVRLAEPSELTSAPAKQPEAVQPDESGLDFNSLSEEAQELASQLGEKPKTEQTPKKKGPGRPVVSEQKPKTDDGEMVRLVGTVAAVFSGPEENQIRILQRFLQGAAIMHGSITAQESQLFGDIFAKKWEKIDQRNEKAIEEVRETEKPKPVDLSPYEKPEPNAGPPAAAAQTP